MKNLQQLTGKRATEHQNGSIKFTHNNISLKCKWPKCTNQNTQTDKLDKKPKPIGVVYPGNPSHIQRHTLAQNKGVEEDLPSKWIAQKAGVAILVSNKIDFKATKIKRDKEGHYIMVKGSMEQEELTILNIYAPNTGVPRYIKQVLNDLQRDLDYHTIIVGDFDTPLSILERSTRQKINMDIQDLNADLDQNRYLQNSPPQSTEYTFFSAPHHTYSRIDHIIGSKSLLSKCERMEIITNSLSDYSAIKFELRIKNHTLFKRRHI